VNRDLAFGLAALALAIGYYALAAALPDTMLADAVGPQGLPKTYAVVLGVLSLILIAQSIRPGARSPKPDARSPEPEDRRPKTEVQRLWRVAGLLLIGVLYIALVPWLGYVVALAGLLAATTYYQGGRLDRQVALVSGGGALFFWVLFVWVLGIPQPAGVWPSFL
jgi:putative tricarboxylic transport membrane protein